MNGEMIRARLHSGERVYGTHVCSLANPNVAMVQAKFDYDFVFICNEHMPIDRTETSMLCHLYATRGVSPIVRISCPDAAEAATALDGGAQGVVVPYVETVEEVKAIIGAVKYRPVKGKKLQGYLDGSLEPTEKMMSFFERFNRQNYVIIGIESYEAYENLDALIGVRGVDGVFVGPHDMTVSMDIPEEYDNPKFLEVVEDIAVRCRKAGIGMGAHFSQVVTEDERYLSFMRKGMNWILYGADLGVLMHEMPKRLRELRAEMGDNYVVAPTGGVDVSLCIGAAKQDG